MAVMHLAFLYCFISLISTESLSFLFSTANEAQSIPLYTYLYKYLTPLMLQHTSTLIWQLYLIRSVGLYGTTHLLSNHLFLINTLCPSSRLLYIGYASFPCYVESQYWRGYLKRHAPSTIHAHLGLRLPHGPCIMCLQTSRCRTGCFFLIWQLSGYVFVIVIRTT